MKEGGFVERQCADPLAHCLSMPAAGKLNLNLHPVFDSFPKNKLKKISSVIFSFCPRGQEKVFGLPLISSLPSKIFYFIFAALLSIPLMEYLNLKRILHHEAVAILVEAVGMETRSPFAPLWML